MSDDIKLAQLWNSQAAMQRLLHSDKLEMVLSWRLSKLVKVLGEIEEQRQMLVKKLGQKDPESGLTEVLPKNMSAYREQFDALLDEPLEVKIEPIELARLSEVGLTPFEVAALSDLGLILPPDEDDGGEAAEYGETD